MDSTEYMPKITVAAEALVDVQSTIGTLTIEVSSVASEASTAFSMRKDSIGIVHRVLDLVPDLEVRNEQVTESNDADDRYGDRSAPQMYRARWQVDVVCDLRDGDKAHGQMRELVSRLAAVDNVKVTGPRWSLDPRTARTVRTSAMADALVSASEQADIMVEPFGQKTGKVLDAKMNFTGHRGMLDEPVARGRRAEAMMAAGSAPPERTLDLDLIPATETVTAEVTATFALLDL